MRGYGLIAAVVTMTITSAGAAGYLSGEFQKAVMGVQEGTVKVDVLKSQIAKYEERKKQIDATIAAIPDRYSANQKIKLMGQYKQEQKDLQDKIAAIDKDLPALQIKQIGVEAKAGPILYISKAFSVSIEEAVKWVILLIIVVFDPLAVFLIIAGNFLWDQRPARKKEVANGFTPPEPMPPAPKPYVEYDGDPMTWHDNGQAPRQIEEPQEQMRVYSNGEWGVGNERAFKVPEFSDLNERAAWADTEPHEAPHEEDLALVDIDGRPNADPVDRPTGSADVPEAFAEVNRPELNLAGVARRLKELGLEMPAVAPPVTLEDLNAVTNEVNAYAAERRGHPDTSQTRVYTREDLIAEGASDEMLIEAGYEPREPQTTTDDPKTLDFSQHLRHQEDVKAAAAAGMSLEEWRAAQLAKLDRIQEGVDALAESVGVPSPRLPPPAGRWHRRHDEPAREQITLSSLSKVKPDPATNTGSGDMPPTS
jgi:hypothetical protein